MKFVVALFALIGSMVTTTAGNAIDICGQDFSKSKKHPCTKMDCAPFQPDAGWTCYRCDVDITEDMWKKSDQRKVDQKENDIPHLKQELKDIDKNIQEIQNGQEPGKAKALEWLNSRKAKTIKRIEERTVKRSTYASQQPSKPISQEEAAKKLVEVKKALKEAQHVYRLKQYAVRYGDTIHTLGAHILGTNTARDTDTAGLKKLKAEKDRLRAEKEELTKVVFKTCYAGLHKEAKKYLLMDAKTKSLAYFSTQALPAASAVSALVRRESLGGALVNFAGAVLGFPFKLANNILGIPFAIVGSVIGLIIVVLVFAVVGVIALFALPVYGIVRLVRG